MFQKTYLQSDHRLVVAKVRLKLKAKGRVAQREPRHQIEISSWGEEKVQEFKKLLEEELSTVPSDDVEDAWGSFKETLGEAQKCIPLDTERAEKDWVTD